MKQRQRRRFDNTGLAPIEETPMKKWEKPAMRNISFSNDVATMAILTLLFGALAGAGYQYYLVWLMFGGISALAGLWVAYFIYLYRTTQVAVERIEYQDIVGQEEKDPVALDPGRVAIQSGIGKVVEFVQPHPGEFAKWANVVIKDARDGNLSFRDKAQLSQNTGSKRGWPKEMYKGMLASFRAVGWVTLGQNNTPIFTRYGSDVVYAWLTGQKPPAPSD